MKPFLSLLLIVTFTIYSCKDKKPANEVTEKPAVTKTETAKDPGNDIQLFIDSIRSFKPAKLNINEEHSDVDGLIPLGYNDHGTLAFLVDENTGGSSALHLGVLPAYQDFTLESRLGSDEEKDTILLRNKELVYYALRSQGIRLGKTVEKNTVAEMQKKYGISFGINKAYGPPDKDDPSGKKTLASIDINWRQGETDYPSYILNEKYITSFGIYDVYISDCLVIPGEEGLYGFVVLVTESYGFEGYTRKSIEVKHLGVVKSK